MDKLLKTNMAALVCSLGLLLAGVCNCDQTNSSSNDEELRSLFVIHRHGDRSPVSFAPKDPYKERANDIWKFGQGELTIEGKQRMFKLGKYFRRRYSNYLTENPHEVESLSADIDRCIESGQQVLAGIYPPQGDWVWNEDLAWQPMGVHMWKAENDPIIHMSSRCPKRDNETRDSSEDFSRWFYSGFTDQDQAMKDNLTSHYGYNFTAPYIFFGAHDTHNLERRKGLELPQWLIDNFETLANLSIKSQASETNTHELRRLNSGVLLKDIVEKMKQIRDLDPNETPSQVYEMPDFGASILIELWQNQTSHDHRVRLFYLSDTQQEDKSLRELKLVDCIEDGQTECYLDGFDRSTQQYQMTPDQWFKECGRT